MFNFDLDSLTLDTKIDVRTRTKKMFDELLFHRISQFMPLITRVTIMSQLCKMSRSVVPLKEINVVRTLSYSTDPNVKALTICLTNEYKSIGIVMRKIGAPYWMGLVM